MQELPLFICKAPEDIRGIAPGGDRFPVTRGRRGPGALRRHPRYRISRTIAARAQRAEASWLNPYLHPRGADGVNETLAKVIPLPVARRATVTQIISKEKRNDGRDLR